MLQCLSIHALAGIILCAAWCAHAESAWHHDLDVRLDPAQEHLTVEDTLLAPPAFKGHSLCWSLNAQLAIQHSEPRSMAAKPLGGDAMRYCTELAVDGERFSVRYAGVLPKPRDAPTESVRALVAPDWVYLDPNGGWYPHHADELASVRLAVHLPAGWRAVTQGVRLQRTETADGVLEVWEERQAQEGLYLIAAPFHEYQGAAVPAQALVFLRADDEALARRYLDATQRYLDFYGRLLGPYAYGKFALVENNWDSGFGMPSFTLLGPRVIRLPFLLESSYPHEILHNWWGNGVYVNDQSGNWSEGLTSYLADYLIAEQQGRGTEYRRNTLQRYLNYVGAARDFPLAEFRARHSEASQSVGYDKGLMFFHMLRRRLGDAVFVEGLRRFYHDQRGQRAGFDDLRLAWESTGNQNLQSDFAAWLTQPGAPALRLSDVQARPDGQGYRLSATLEQLQDGPAYRLDVPLAVQMMGEESALQTTVAMTGKRQIIDLALARMPERLAVDPEFDLMRRLDRDEIPSTFGQVFGAERLLIVLPVEAPDTVKAAYQGMAEAWAAERGGEVRWDSELGELPSGYGIWLLGRQNRFLGALGIDWKKPLEPVPDDLKALLLAADENPQAVGLVLVLQRPHGGSQALAWLDWDDVAGLRALARKLPHYGKYSFLGFRGATADNVLKGQWPVLDSPLNQAVASPDGRAPPPWRARLAARPALAVMAELPHPEPDRKAPPAPRP